MLTDDEKKTFIIPIVIDVIKRLRNGLTVSDIPPIILSPVLSTVYYDLTFILKPIFSVFFFCPYAQIICALVVRFQQSL